MLIAGKFIGNTQMICVPLSTVSYLFRCPLHSGNRKEVCHVGDIFINLFVAVGANMIAYYICKWLDSRGKGQ